MTIKKILIKNEDVMLKNYKTHEFFLSLFFFTHTMMGMNSVSPYAYDSYIPPIVLCTHKINQCFSNASLLIESSPNRAREEINKCYSFITNLEKIIKDFSQLPLKRLVRELETLAKHSSDQKTKSIIIDQIIPRLSSFDPANDNIYTVLSAIKSMYSTNDVVDSLISSLSTIQLSMNTTHNIVNSILSPFPAIRDQLDKLNHPSNTPDEFRTGLLNIMAQYDSIFSQFKSTTSLPRHRSSKEPMSAVSKIIFKNILITHTQEIQNLLSEKNDVIQQLKIEPQLLQSPTKIFIAKVSLFSKVLARVPLLERLFCWILNNYNEIVKKLMRARTYDCIKNDACFHYIRRLHENNLIRAANIDNILNNPTADKVIDLICQESQAFIDYCNNLQKYYCIELLECLHRSHKRSQEMLRRKNQHFSFVYEHTTVPNDNTIDRKLEQNKTNWTLSSIQGGATRLFSDIKNTAITTVAVASSLKKITSWKGIKNLATTTGEVTKLFVSSLSPWYQPPTNVGPTSARPEVIVAPQQARGITGFLLADSNKQPMNSLNTQPKIREKDKITLQNMIDAHITLEQGYSRKYQEYKKTITTPLPNEWDSVPSQIDTLYQSLVKLDEERKNVWFFDIWNKGVNWQKRNKITNTLQHHIDAHNMARINLYNQDKFCETSYDKSSKPTQESPYTKYRKKFLDNFHLSPQDNNDIFMISQKNDLLKTYRYIFNPLEQSEIRRALK
jgi:hypothetical protein